MAEYQSRLAPEPVWKFGRDETLLPLQEIATCFVRSSVCSPVTILARLSRLTLRNTSHPLYIRSGKNYEIYKRSSCLLVRVNQQDATFLSLFISVRRSTCFRRGFRPSSGAQNCTHSARYLSHLYKHTVMYTYQSIATKPYYVYYCIRATCFDSYRIIFRPF